MIRDTNDSFDTSTIQGERESLVMIKRAVTNAWNIPDELKEKIPLMMAKIAVESKLERNRIRAVEVLRYMSKDNLDAAVALDRVERLDEGKSTEIMSHKVAVVNDAKELRQIIDEVRRRGLDAIDNGQPADRWGLPDTDPHPLSE